MKKIAIAQYLWWCHISRWCFAVYGCEVWVTALGKYHSSYQCVTSPFCVSEWRWSMPVFANDVLWRNSWVVKRSCVGDILSSVGWSVIVCWTRWMIRRKRRMIKLSLCWNQVVRWLRRDISKIIILCIVWEIFFQNEQKYSCRGPELIMLGPQDTRLVPWLIMPGHRLFMSRPKLLRWEYDRGAEIYIGAPTYYVRDSTCYAGPRDKYVGSPTYYVWAPICYVWAPR